MTEQTTSKRSPIHLDARQAAIYAVYAAMASNAYHDREKIYFDLPALGWELVDREGEPISSGPTYSNHLTSLAFDILEKKGTNESVIAMRGSDSLLDWLDANLAIPVSIQYKSALKKVREYITSNPERHTVIVGHSLGGGIALSVSVYVGIPAFTFDPSPRIFDGLGDHHMPAQRVAIYEDGEPLDEARKLLSDKFDSIVSASDYYVASYDFGAISRHRIDVLAYEMLASGATLAPGLRTLLTSAQVPPALKNLFDQQRAAMYDAAGCEDGCGHGVETPTPDHELPRPY